MKKSLFLDYLYILIGCASLALGLDMFIYPCNLSPGGVSGLAAVIHYYIPGISVGTWAFLINLPLLICAWRILGFRPLFRTLTATILLSVFIDLFALFLPSYDGDTLMSAVLGGVFSGAGVGVLFLRGISTGGTDLVSILLVHHFPNIPAGRLLLMADATVVLANVLAFRNIEIGIYSFVIIYISSKVIDAMMDGANYAKVIYIVTDKGDVLNTELNARTDRGVTLIPATGGYTGQNKQLLFTVTRQSALAQTLDMIKEIDPCAFSFVVNAAEVHGEGFRRYRADISPDDSKQ